MRGRGDDSWGRRGRREMSELVRSRSGWRVGGVDLLDRGEGMSYRQKSE